MDQEALRSDILVTFDFAHDRPDFVNPVAEALDGVSTQEALWRPSPAQKCIWEIVLHMTVWTENGVRRMQSGQHSRPAERAWPRLPADLTDEAWREDLSQLKSALAALRAQIEATSSAALIDRTVTNGQQRWSPLIEALSRSVHNAYHLGQITKLRDMHAAMHVG